MTFFDQLNSELQPHITAILEHRFLKRIYNSTLSKSELRYFILQYGIYCQYFPRFLAAAASAIPDDRTRSNLIKNLWEEHGSGDIRKSHRVLYEKFAQAGGVNPEELYKATPITSTHVCVEYLLKLCQDHQYVRALGALGPGTEFFTDREYQLLMNGLAGFSCFTQDDLEFWHVHIDLDNSHASEIIESLTPHAQTPHQRQLIREGALRAVELELLFWEGLEDGLNTIA